MNQTVNELGYILSFKARWSVRLLDHRAVVAGAVARFFSLFNWRVGRCGTFAPLILAVCLFVSRVFIRRFPQRHHDCGAVAATGLWISTTAGLAFPCLGGNFDLSRWWLAPPPLWYVHHFTSSNIASPFARRSARQKVFILPLVRSRITSPCYPPRPLLEAPNQNQSRFMAGYVGGGGAARKG